MEVKRELTLGLIRKVFGWFLILIFLYYIRKNISGINEIENPFVRENIKPAILFIIGLTLANILRALRLWNLGNKVNSKITLTQTLIAFPKIFLYAAFIPFRAGEGYKVIWLKENNVPFSDSAGITVFERVLDIVALVLLGSIAIIIAPIQHNFISTNGIAIIIAILILGISVVAFRNRIARFLLTILSQFSGNTATQDYQASRSNLNLSKSIFTSAIITIGIWTSLAFSFHGFLSLFFEQFRISHALLTLMFVNFSNFLAIAPGNIGMYQAAGVAALVQYDYDQSLALKYMVYMHLVNLAFTIITGCASITFVYFQNKSIHKNRLSAQ